MTNFLVSSLSLSSAPRSSVSRVQQDLVIAQKEVVTGRFADVGLSLGVSVGRTISMRSEMAGNEKLTSANTQLAQRFATMQSALETTSQAGEGLLNSLISGGDRDASAKANKNAANNNIGQLVGALNSSFGSRYLFSGAKTNTPPMKVDASNAPPELAAVKTAWQDFLGTLTPPDDPSIVTGADMEAFLKDDPSGPFEKFFTDANWTANWSDASDQQTQARIGENETITSSASANDKAFRDVMKAYVMTASFDIDLLGSEARQVLTSRAIDTLSGGLSNIRELRSEIGIGEERIARTNEGLKSQKMVLKLAIGEEESVDVYEASTRVTNLMNTLETSYALTARISRLSLLNYL
ncbi:flagellar hook-associated family protein [Fulvimarina sp. 2208YS6-2-32]|uniref:Flagellin n=1 Tax=Fulvimarina uroteuthidis TaxID=3098149 RepID=A0ABU5HYM5_9HYPH|nr:flagellar hook-associated family protein [Fulvimarina sp. 2208YS6-2-32]MDY8108086.1 flagellar hook-associated family protein [Fulvimarina sp. 2208YS6-2-32]